jgi:Fic family protein
MDESEDGTVIDWIRESNLIEGIDDPIEDEISTNAWKEFQACPYLSLLSTEDLHGRVTYRQFSPNKMEWCGRFRVGPMLKSGINVTVGNRICPHWRNVPKLMEEWISMFRQPKSEEMIRQAHIKFEGIHPFLDGNGRVGRMILQFHRQKIGLEPFLIKSSKREDYYSWFKELE